ncbi:hypothetical protein [Colobopsis shohki virus 1]|nr:hypothetical protein [Colobopsis shohki virus 1]
MAFNVEHLSSHSNSNLSFLSNPSGFSFFGNENGATYANAISSLSLDSASSTRSSGADKYGNTFVQTHQDRLDNAWGIDTDNNVIDDDNVRDRAYFQNKINENSSTINNFSETQINNGDADGILEFGNTADEAAVDTPEILEGIAEASEVAASDTPIGIAALINQQVGQGLNQAMSASLQNQQSQDYISNISQHGVNVALSADIIRQSEQQTIDSKNAGGSLGSLLGPLGTVIGRAAAGAVQQNDDALKTDASFSGWVDPTDTNIANSASTVDPSGVSDMVQSF